ncbi:MAG: phosphoribosylformylglycinamidine synthase, partial [Oscillospiraceae bacterium]|nr:phosphoribosylformylglycinamidine synthase [Oscillospiraceae bacterium]
MVYRIFVEKKQEFAVEAASILREIRSFVRIDSLTDLRLLVGYDVEGIEEELFDRCIGTVFSYPATDIVHEGVPEADEVFAVEYLPGQYDQRADSAAQCIQVVSGAERPTVRCLKVYCLYGPITEEELGRIKKYLINSVECRQTSLDTVGTLVLETACPQPIGILEGFRGLTLEELKAFLDEYSLAMDIDDLLFTQEYFKEIGRDPTETEVRVLDTYWSDHCRHTTFLTRLDEVVIEDERQRRSYDRYLSVKRELGREQAPVTLMDIATAGMRLFRSKGMLDRLELSEEVNACTVKTEIDVDGVQEDWLFLFKNETHNHPTEIEPFGGAATCVGGGIRDPLSGRSFVYQAMRVTGAADPTLGIETTLPGKLPQRRITTVAAEGNSSYGNQAGLTAGYINEIYHPGYAAKRMEIGALVGAAPAENVVKAKPVEGDVVILLGGRTGRDGIGAATGSSKTQDVNSLEDCGAEVQKGDAPQGRKLQRLFRDPNAARLIKRCNDFGAGGVSVAIGELADGLDIDLDAVPLKYEGLDGTEIAISESQERMAVVISKKDAESFIELAAGEGLEATPVARVTKEPKLVMHWRNQIIVSLDRSFLSANGAPKHAGARILPGEGLDVKGRKFREGFFDMAKDLNCAGKRGLIERFCSTVGTRTLFMPLGGKYQATPTQSMAALFPVLDGHTNAASVMAYGFDPFISEKDPYRGAYIAVVDSLSKLAAAGALTDETYLSFQEYFERLKDDPVRWGKPLSALLGALDAQLDFSVAAVGGKDSMSGSFEDIDVPPTLVSFAVSVADSRMLITPEFKAAGNAVSLLLPEYDEETGLMEKESQKKVWQTLMTAIGEGKVLS